MTNMNMMKMDTDPKTENGEKDELWKTHRRKTKLQLPNGDDFV